MARKHLIAGFIVVGMVTAIPIAQATYPVLDVSVVAKSIEQIAELKKQVATQLEQLNELRQSVAFLNDISGFVNDTQKAIGKVASLKLPVPNLERIAAQTKGDMRCLMPDGLKWGIKFEDLNLGSICETSAKYRQSLFVDSEAMKGQTYAQQRQARLDVELHRTALLEDTASRALAQADIQLKQADELNTATDKLQDDLDAAETLQDRTHIQAQTQIAQARATARQTQILAQMLKLQAAVAIMSGLPADKIKEIVPEAGK